LAFAPTRWGFLLAMAQIALGGPGALLKAPPARPAQARIAG
jgi:hypothetical protein